MESAKKAVHKDKPALGTFYYIIYTILKSLSFVFVHYLYEHTEIDAYQLLFARSLIACFTVIIMVNKDLKKALYDGINRSNVNPLLFRSIQGTVSNFINYSVVKFIPASVNSVIN